MKTMTTHSAVQFCQVSRDRRVAVVVGGEVHVTRGTMSRTGRVYGNVDEGFCVQVTARDALGDIVFSERLHAPERRDPTTRNRAGLLGAWCDQEPAQVAIDETVARAAEHLTNGAPRRPLVIRKVAAAAPPEGQAL